MPRFFRAHRLQPFALGHLLSCAQEFFATSTSNSSSDQNPSMCYQITHSQFVAPILFAASTTVGHWTFNKNPLFLQQIHHKKDGATNRLPYCNKKNIMVQQYKKNYRNKCLLLPHVATKGCGNIETTPCNMPAPRRSTGNTSCNNGERVRQQFKITPAACLPRGEVRGQRSSRARGRRMPIWCLATALPDLARLVGCLVTGRAVGPTRVAPGGGCRGLGLGLGARRRRQPPSCTAPTPQRLKRPRNHCWHSAR